MITELESKLLKAKEKHNKIIKNYIELVNAGNFEKSADLIGPMRSAGSDVVELKEMVGRENIVYTERERSNLNQSVFKLLLTEIANCDLTKSVNPFWGKYEIGAAVDKLLETYDITLKAAKAGAPMEDPVVTALRIKFFEEEGWYASDEYIRGFYNIKESNG